MGSRDLFDKGTPYKVLKASNLNEDIQKAESERNIKAKRDEANRFVPRIDYSNPNNFVRFGSAEQYYEDAFDRILAEYPYDGSEAEIQEFFNSSSYLDLYVFENEYPKTTGYVTLSSNGWGTQSSETQGWGVSSDLEYIEFYGGPHTASGGMPSGSLATQFTGANYYDTDIYDSDRDLAAGRVGTRESNLKFDWPTGQAVEFWLKKDEFIDSLTEKEVIFDLWNGEASGSDSYGRLTLFLTASSTPLRMNVMSGTTGFADVNLNTGLTDTTLADGTWRHYAVTFKSGSTAADINVYVDGNPVSSLSSAINFQEVTGALRARIGALTSAPSGNVYHGIDLAGAGKLSASLDEFRYWKADRTHEEIGLNFWTQIRGGTNTDISNTELGVYYKFNEGITSDTSLDSIVIDYSGRITNGAWYGYPGSTARNTGSAIVSSSLGLAEKEDPIIYATHPTVASKKSALIQSGSVFDFTNNSTMYNRIPAWIVDEDPGTLKQMMQIMSSYLDSLHLQMEELPRLKNTEYVSGSNRELPISNRLLLNAGMQAPEIFADADLLAQFMSKDEERNFELDLFEIKNRIYKNVYNNLVHIYKTKGSFRSYRNLIRCYGIDDDVVRLNIYGNNTTSTIRDNYEPTISRKRYVNFNDPSSFGGVVTQQSQSSNPNASNVTFVSGTVNEYLATTSELEVIFPKYETDRASLNYFERTFYSASIFGNHRLATDGDPDCFIQSAVGDDYAWGLYAVKPDLQTSDGYFVLKSHKGSTPDFYLTSSVYTNLYDNEKWNFAVRISNVGFPMQDGVSGSNTDLKVELYGVNYDAGVLKNELYITASNVTAGEYLTADHRYYVGAERTNWTGSLQERTDIKASSLRHWESYLDDDAVKAHARDAHNFGSLRPYNSTYLLQSALTGTIVPQIATLALNWDYDNVTGSDSNGEFFVSDRSSGSVEQFDRYHDNENTDQYSKTVGYQYTGRAYHMKTSTTGALDKAYLSTERQNAPESLSSADMVSILTLQDDVEFTRDSRPINYYFSFEKSMYATITQEMLNFFGSVVAFNDLIGDPKNRYRQDYKELEKLRQLFFEKVGNTPDLDKYVEYYKWIDNSLATMLMSMVPATADFSDGIRTMIESHVLERNKYWTKFPTTEFKDSDDLEASLRGITELKYDWQRGHAPVNGQQDTNCFWWKERAERTSPELSSSVASVNVGRDNFREVIETYRTGSPPDTFTVSTDQLPAATYQGSTYALRRFDEVYNITAKQDPLTHAGPNYSQRKRAGFVSPALAAFESNKQTLDIIASVDEEKDCDDTLVPEEINKVKASFEYKVGLRDDFLGLSNDPYTLQGIGDIYTPFTLYSSSVENGYVSSPFTNSGITLQDVFSGSIESYHYDVIGEDMEISMQSPFTEKFVGGNQRRHQDLIFDPALTSSANRAEAWKLFADGTNKLQLVVTSGPRAIYTRGEIAKRPINIQNIQAASSDAGHVETGYVSGTLRSNLGNFNKFYEVVQTSGRNINNVFFVENEGITVSGTVSALYPVIVDYTKPERGSHKHVIVERFSAPGGPETAGDSNGGYGLDLESAELSPYNALPFRNSTVREVLNSQLLRNHTRQFGFYSGSSVSADDYSGTGSFDKTNRNPLRSPQLEGPIGYGLGFDYATVVTGVVYDNYYVTHEIPRMETSYAWISSSFISDNAYGHGSPDGFFSSSAGITSNINFVSASDNGSDFRTASSIREALVDPKTLTANFVPTTTHLNINIVEPFTASSMTTGYELDTPVGHYINYGDIDTQPFEVQNNDSFIESVLNDNFTTASVLHELLIHRNGYYGHPSWKQIRVGESKIVRHFRENNKITISPQPGAGRVVSGFGFLKDRFGPAKTFTEPPVDPSYKPLRYNLEVKGKRTTLNVSYGNMLNRFSNIILDNETTDVVGKNEIYGAYDKLKQAYLDGALNTPTSPITNFTSLKYSQQVYPATYNVGLEKVRERENFKVKFWANTREERSTLGLEKSSSMGAPYYGRFNQITQSAWPLDASEEFETGPICTASNASSSAAGELQNDYMMVHNDEKMFITASAIYSRKHMLFSTRSTTCLLLDNPQTGSTTNTVDPTRRQGDVDIYGGNALWEAGRLAGRIKTTQNYVLDANGNTILQLNTEFESDPRYPIDPDYESNMEDAILQSKGYSIIPEFRISEHMDLYGITQDPLVENDALFQIYGASGTLPTDSSEDSFYTIFSNSDFMRNFEQIYEDHTNFRKPTSIKLRCKGIKKFLPYDGFYPAERTLDLATQFSKSYGSFVNTDVANDGFASEAGTYPKAALRPFIAPFFAPGIMYNTIKSGIAVDYGTYSGSYAVVDNGEVFFVGRPTHLDNTGRGHGFDKRVPFEAIVSPADYIANEVFVDMEPHPSASMNLTSSWDGQGDPLYEMMMNNFLAESINMFLPNGQMSALVSAKEDEYETFEIDKVYAMRIKLRKSFNQARTYNAGGSNANVLYPFPQVRPEEIGEGLRETFTMYSRPTAFGPPMAGRTISTVDIATVKADPLSGYNPAYTPPYYDGEAWCDIIFKATQDVHTLDEIIAEAKISHWRIDNTTWTVAGNGINDITKPYDRSNVNEYAMQLTASINVLGKAQINSIEYRPDGTPVLINDSPNNTQGLLVIQPKFETPMFNFTPTSGALRPITEADGNLTIPDNGKETVPRGMWHQFGLAPDTPDKGVFLEVVDISDVWSTNRIVNTTVSSDLEETYYKDDLTNQGGVYASLIDQLKFTRTGTRLGDVREEIKVHEAIVAVPFYVENGVRNFFTFSKDTVDSVLTGNTTSGVPELDPGDSIKRQIDLMQKYVFPPAFNFLDFPDQIDPVAMYIFEFGHVFTKDDLSYMWQNLPPKIGTEIEFADSIVTHPLLVNELMGARSVTTGRAIQRELQWMVFKVKQKANTNYYDKLLTRVGTDNSLSFNFTMNGTPSSLDQIKYSYNWPYDFFSLVEFANMESEITFGNIPEAPNEDYYAEVTPVQSVGLAVDSALDSVTSETDEPI
jgi:hypothetical protein